MVVILYTWSLSFC